MTHFALQKGYTRSSLCGHMEFGDRLTAGHAECEACNEALHDLAVAEVIDEPSDEIVDPTLCYCGDPFCDGCDRV